MVVARRLLLAGAGSGAFTPPTPVESSLIADGAWTYTGANAIRYNGVVYFGWVDASGNVEVATYTEATGVTSSAVTLHAALETDWHDAPAITVRDDGHIVAAYSRHSGTTMYVRVSTNSEDISAWGSEVSLDASLGGFQYTYPWLFAAGSTLWLFYRNDGPGVTLGEPSYWSYSTSTDGGTTWAAQTQLYTTTDTTRLCYFNVDFDGVSRFDFAVTDGTYDADNASVYHFWMTTAGARYKSDGTSIAASLPIKQSDCTLVHTAVSGARYPYAIRSGSGNPVITWPEWTAGAKDWYYARWNGSSWDVTNVVSDGTTGAAWVEGGFSPEYADPSVAWLSRSTGGHYQVFRYKSWDNGATWTATQISTSPSDDFYPVAVRNAGRLRAIWLRGTASSATSFSLAIRGGTLY